MMGLEAYQLLRVYGLDTLVTLELRTWMVSELGATFPLASADESNR